MSRPEQSAIISGIGQSAVGRRLGRDQLDLTLDASLEAIADAGLTVEDIDGLATYPGSMGGPPGFGGPGSPTVQDALRLSLNWHSGGGEGPAQLQAVINAVMAVSMGLARHVLVYRTVTESTAQGTGHRQAIGAGGGGPVAGDIQWRLPFRAYSAANWLGMYAQRHMHEYGVTEEQFAQIALNGRRNAGLNPKAVYRDPLTMEDYLASRMISSPFRLFDCDVPADGSTALIVSAAEHGANLDHPAARVEAVGSALRGRPSWELWDDLTTMPARTCADQMWSRTDLRPADVDVAGLYDGFSWLAMSWLEALGFCGRGEAGAFIEGGGRIARDGELPLNTNGGQLSAGRLHGFGYFHEVVLQLRGEAGDRQVPDDPEVGVVSNGGGPLAGCMLLTRLDGR